MPDIALWNEVRRAHERLDLFEKAVPEMSSAELHKLILALEREFRNEIQGLKMRMGKK
jgi:hypothetical protein